MDKKVQEFVFSTYEEMTRKKCLKMIFICAFLCCVFTLPFRSKVYRFLSLYSACMIIVWFLYLMMSQRRNLPENKYLSDGIVCAYMSWLFLYSGYALLCHEEKPVVFLILFFLWFCCSFINLKITKKEVQKGAKRPNPIWNAITVPAAALGYLGAKAFFPHMEYKTVMEIGIVLSIICALLLSFACSTNFLKTMLIRKYHLVNNSYK